MIFVSPTGEKPPLNQRRNAYKANQDGVGLVWHHNNKTYYKKGLMTEEKYLREFDLIPEGSPYMVHLRFQSIGEISHGNCHPFMSTYGHLVVHNGTVTHFGDIETSDTLEFVTEVYDTFLERDGGILSARSKVALEKIIGSGKMVIMDMKGNITFLNEQFGHWNEDYTIWYANSGYQDPITTTRRFNYEHRWKFSD
jgi:glutamine phosphoribosylpyrophosphate amidotransferase